jgi:hypothetical protein
MEESGVKGERFASHLKKFIVPLKSNIYINPADPMYYEKIIRYVDRNSPEAHYYLGMKYVRAGSAEKAAYHLGQSARMDSTFGYKARAELQRLHGSGAAGEALLPQAETRGSRRFPWLLAAMLFLAVCSLLLFSNGLSPVRAILTQAAAPSAGVEVVYETTEKPFVIFIPADKPAGDIEKLMYDRTLALGTRYPKLNVQLYGVYASGGQPTDELSMPLRNPALKDQAFVVGEYHAASESTVRIRFVENKTSAIQPSSNLFPYIQFGTNLVRTALVQYKVDHGKLPNDLQELLRSYPNNYITALPLEPVTGTDRVASRYDGTGGWLYEPEAERIEDAFRPNLPLNVSYHPIEIIVAKDEHAVYVLNGSFIISKNSAGLGRNDSTPEGEYRIEQRVRFPQGSKPGVYGAAGLGFGDIALHGTNHRDSVGADLSAGCVRMYDEDIASIFPAVPMGAHVRIVDQMAVLEGERLLSPQVVSMFPGDSADSLLEKAEGIVFAWLG